MENRTGWYVAALGAVVTIIGYYVGDIWGAGIMGFGLAHILLGILDTFRNKTKAEA